MALYRKYRPATFAEVVGQEQVTRPLSTALDAGRINHAYLFSGPRGCGKTSSARIMARSLNCEQGPTSTPCGVCDSCVSLAPGGPGNLDVTELDAASHNGVDDMRDLRDRAYFAPAESRYRIFIIDEAHMISNAGFNALLKVVEEPPEHVIFIFATTELEKMLPTIRSRTHNYPFRLLTPSAMKGLLQRTVAAEGVTVEDSVYPMVISAGGGSPRDTLSILDQLLAGAGPDGLTYDLARPLLGITDISVIDDAVAALAAGDKAAFFQLIDAVVESGEEPRRFATDLLDRLRDLLVLQAVPDAVAAGLVAVPEDRAEAMTNEAAAFSNAQLAHLASALNEELPKLRGASSPRLLLEIMGARLLSAPAPAAAPGPALGPSGATAGVPAASAAASAAGPGAPAASVPSA
ncbi:DNA polymerase III subunit gamma and tau, partial [Corynebacterium sp. HMSC065A05]